MSSSPDDLGREASRRPVNGRRARRNTSSPITRRAICRSANWRAGQGRGRSWRCAARTWSTRRTIAFDSALNEGVEIAIDILYHVPTVHFRARAAADNTLPTALSQLSRARRVMFVMERLIDLPPSRPASTRIELRRRGADAPAAYRTTAAGRQQQVPGPHGRSADAALRWCSAPGEGACAGGWSSPTGLPATGLPCSNT